MSDDARVAGNKSMCPDSFVKQQTLGCHKAKCSVTLRISYLRERAPPSYLACPGLSLFDRRVVAALGDNSNNMMNHGAVP